MYETILLSVISWILIPTSYWAINLVISFLKVDFQVYFSRSKDLKLKGSSWKRIKHISVALTTWDIWFQSYWKTKVRWSLFLRRIFFAVKQLTGIWPPWVTICFFACPCLGDCIEWSGECQHPYLGGVLEVSGLYLSICSSVLRSE